jgi:HEAT repeat protein
MVTTTGGIIAGNIVKTIAKSTLADRTRDSLVDFLSQQVKDIRGKELSDRIATLRSDASLRKQIQQALERAAKRWSVDCPDRELVSAVAENTRFTDLPAVQDAVRTLAQNPFDQIPSSTLRNKFTEVLPPRFELERVERAIAELLEMLREEFVVIPTVREAQGIAAAIQTARNTAQLPDQTATLQRIEDLLQGPSPTEQTLQEYLSWVINQHRYLDPRGTMQTVRQVQVLMEDVYVSLMAEAEPLLGAVDRRIYEDDLKALMEHGDLNAEEKEDLRENLLAKFVRNEERPSSGQPIELAELTRRYAKLVILGDPGAGKTTLLRYLALMHAQALRYGRPKAGDLGPTRLPLYLRIAVYAEHGKGRSLLDFLPACICGEEHTDKALEDLIRNRLAEGSCLVLIDGLDEVIEPGDRSGIAAQIDDFVRGHEPAGNRFVITSRVAGYRTASLSGDIAHYRVRDMNDEQIQRFLQQWCSAVERFQTPDLRSQAQAEKAKAETDSISQAVRTNPGVRRLAANPLMLRTLALIHRTGARLPQRRVELYRLAAETLIRDWELARGLPQAVLVSEPEATRLLAELAAWLHKNKPAGIATEGEAKHCLAEVKAQIAGKNQDDPEIENAVADFLNRIRQHTGLFVERAPRRFGFMHLTFEEYFTARWLVARPREAAKRIRGVLHRPRWEEPILLAIAFYGMEFPDDVDALIEEAILGKELDGPSPYESVLHRDLLFAIRCLGDQDVGPHLRMRLVNEFSELCLDRKERSISDSMSVRINQDIKSIQGSPAWVDLEHLLLASLHNENADTRRYAVIALRNTVQQPEVVSALMTALQDKNEDVRYNAVKALGNAVQQPEVVSSLLTALKDDNSNVRSSAAENLRNVVQQPEVVSALLAALKDKNDGVHYSAVKALGNAIQLPEVVSALLAALKDKNISTRYSAAEALYNATLSAEDVPGLLAVLQDRNLEMEPGNAYTLKIVSLSAKAVSALLIALKDKDEGLRRGAACALHYVTLSAEMVSALLIASHDENSAVCRNAAVTLRDAVKQPEAVPALLAALKDKNEGVRYNAAEALGNTVQQPEVVVALLAALKDENSGVRSSAARDLRNAVQQPEVVSALLITLQDKISDVRSSAARALRDAVQQPEVASALLAALKDENPDTRSSAAEALGNTVQQPEVVVALLAALKDENSGVRSSAARDLRNAVQQPEVVSALLDTLKDEDSRVRTSAAGALFYAIQKPEVVFALLTALKDKDEGVRFIAAEALNNAVQQPEVVSALLLAVLQDKDKYVRYSAANALQNATLSAEAVPILLTALQDKNMEMPPGITHTLAEVNLSIETVPALLDALKDGNSDVRRCAAFELNGIAQKTESRKLKDVVSLLASILDLPGMDIVGRVGFERGTTRGFLIDALYAIAPYPLAND